MCAEKGGCGTEPWREAAGRCRTCAVVGAGLLLRSHDPVPGNAVPAPCKEDFGARRERERKREEEGALVGLVTASGQEVGSEKSCAVRVGRWCQALFGNGKGGREISCLLSDVKKDL